MGGTTASNPRLPTTSPDPWKCLRQGKQAALKQCKWRIPADLARPSSFIWRHMTSPDLPGAQGKPATTKWCRWCTIRRGLLSQTCCKSSGETTTPHKVRVHMWVGGWRQKSLVRLLTSAPPPPHTHTPTHLLPPWCRDGARQ
jgi:hypothetical protein